MPILRHEDIYTAEQLDFIKQSANPQLNSVELTRMFNERFGTNLLYGTVKLLRRKYAAPETRFDHSEYLRNIQKSKERPGVEYIDFYGYTRIKVAGVSRCINKQRIIWEAAYGKCPPGFNIIFIDGNKANFDLSNLIAIPPRLINFMCGKKIPYFVLINQEAVENIILLFQIGHRIKNRDGSKPPQYRSTSRPGFAVEIIKQGPTEPQEVRE